MEEKTKIVLTFLAFVLSLGVVVAVMATLHISDAAKAWVAILWSGAVVAFLVSGGCFLLGSRKEDT